MAGILERLGFSLSRISHKPFPDKNSDPHAQDLPTEDPEIIQMRERRKKLYAQDTQAVGKAYARWVPDGLLGEMCDRHNFMHVHWGSRKVGRLTNLCRNILDVEMLQEHAGITRDDFEPMVKLFFWSSMLYPMTVMWALKVEDVDSHFRKLFTDWLSRAGLSKDETQLILHAVFLGHQTVPGNIVLDVWHDALKLEEMQFGFGYLPETMRTTLGKNQVFATKAKRDCSANLSPHWLLVMQSELNETRFSHADIAGASDQLQAEDSIS